MPKLLKSIEAFMVRHDMEPSRFGIEALNDSGLVFDLRAGERKMRRRTVTRIKEFMAKRDEAARAGQDSSSRA